MHKLTIKVENIVREKLPKHFAIIFYAWTEGEAQYKSVYATFPSAINGEYNQLLLACSPMEHEHALHANEHYTFLEFFLGVFNKTMETFRRRHWLKL